MNKPTKSKRDLSATIGECQCGHSQLEHGYDTTYDDRPNQVRAPGHGGCLAFNCPCPQFTWVGWM